MAERFPPFGTVPTRPRCHYCGEVIVVDLHADDDLWEAVMRDKFGTGYACVNCFASRADEKLIDWAPYIRLTPLSFAGQMRVQADASGGAGTCCTYPNCKCERPEDGGCGHPVDLSRIPGQVLGNGYPDWPDDLTTFKEREAYQRGVAHARAIDGVAAVPPRIGPEGWKRLAESQQALGEAEKRIEEISDRYGLGGASGVQEVPRG